jgi:hypothetical protein
MPRANVEQRIAYEMARQDIPQAISYAITDAIRYYQTVPSTFNETRLSMQTEAGVKFYPLPPDYALIHTVKLTIFNSVYPLNVRDWDYLEKIDWGHNYWRGQPQDYATFEGLLRLYPIPYAVWPLDISYNRKRPEDDEFWFNEFEPVIRNRAKFNIYSGVMFDAEAAAIASGLEQDELRRLLQESTRKISTGRLQTSYF